MGTKKSQQLARGKPLYISIRVFLLGCFHDFPQLVKIYTDCSLALRTAKRRKGLDPADAFLELVSTGTIEFNDNRIIVTGKGPMDLHILRS
jgi:hypothetical protein